MAEASFRGGSQGHQGGDQQEGVVQDGSPATVHMVSELGPPVSEQAVQLGLGGQQDEATDGYDGQALSLMDLTGRTGSFLYMAPEVGV